MELDVLNVSGTKEGKRAVIIKLITAVCLNVSFWLTFLSMINVGISFVLVLMMIVTQCVMFFISMNKIFGRFVVFYTLMLAALCLLLGYAFFGKAFMLIMNRVADALNSENGLVLVPFSVDVGGSDTLYLLGGLAPLMLVSAALFLSGTAWIMPLFVVLGLVFGLSVNVWFFCFLIVSFCAWLLIWNSNAFERSRSLFLEVTAALTVFLLILGFVLSSFSSWPFVAKIHDSVGSKLESARFDGDAASETAFFITANAEPKNMYFKTSVSELDRKAYTGEYLGLLEYLAKDNYYPCAQLYSFYEKDINRTGSGTKLLTVTIDNVALSSKHLLVPYEVALDSAFDKNKFTENFIVSSGLKGQRTYTYNTYKGTYVDYAESDLEKWAVVSDNNSEKLYRKFVYDNYLDVADDFNASAYGEYAGKRYKDVAYGIRKYFDDSSFGEKFDYCREAVNAFRYCGVPARPASGYYLSDSSYEFYEAVDDVTAKYAVYLSAYHDWVEIYVDGVGWIPVEVIPGFFTLSEIESEEVTTYTDKNRIRDKNIHHDEKETGETSPYDSSDGLVTALKVIGGVAVGVLIIVFAGLFISNKLLVKKIMRADSAESTYAGYRYLLKKLRKVKTDFEKDNLYSLDMGDEFKSYLDLVYEEKYSRSGLSGEKRKQASEYVLRLVKSL